MRNFSLIRGLQVTGTEAVKVLIGRFNCINQDGQMMWQRRALGRRSGVGDGSQVRGWAEGRIQAPASHTSSRHWGHA
jgi:hypothetical protein